MNTPLSTQEAGRISSPALLFDRAAIARNIARTVARAGGADRLRPHVKTHKTREIARMWLDAGVTKHKCATLAEAELLASVGAPDVLVAYPMVGPNCERFARLVRHYPRTRFGITVDHSESLRQLHAALVAARDGVDVYLDVNCGMGRTGIELGSDAVRLCREIHSLPAFRLVGLHVYDGHNNQTAIEQRRELARSII
ncbi:MAG: alanine racemase, partial [Gemmataceae bacterium]|nr:alanine racemase [Gemmataceae bacterium]